MVAKGEDIASPLAGTASHDRAEALATLLLDNQAASEHPDDGAGKVALEQSGARLEAPTRQIDRFSLLTGDDLLALPEPSWLVKNLISSTGLSVLYGPSGAGKSFLALLTGPSPVDRSRTGSKHPSPGRRDRDPAGRRADRRQPQRRHPAAAAARRPARPAGRGQARPTPPEARPLADRGYHHDKYRRLLWARGIKPVIARRGTQHGSGLGTTRSVVERGFAHLHNFRRLRIRYERDPAIHTAFLSLACAILCWRRLTAL